MTQPTFRNGYLQPDYDPNKNGKYNTFVIGVVIIAFVYAIAKLLIL